MGCGHSVHIVNFAIGGFAAMEFFAIPGCYTLLAIVFIAGQYKIGFTKNCVGAFVTNFGNRFYLGNSIFDTAGVNPSTWTILWLWGNNRHSGTACQHQAAGNTKRD
jgi:hypothetical protein